ncbi:hypothetical protein [Anaerovorax odorimutans]|uniref:hypothetical protein n=1 Tax=Anaerovorax odorimutans TaxID=109327 RepID=UPI000411E81F|nr:hypothetical protein [Anaerovorax odorimutans]
MAGFLEGLFTWGLKIVDDKLLNGIMFDSAYKEAGKREKRKDNILKLAKSMENKSDEELKRIFQSNSGDMKLAASYNLKKRGY